MQYIIEYHKRFIINLKVVILNVTHHETINVHSTKNKARLPR